MIIMTKYEVHELPMTERERFVVSLKADSNDADYITTIESYTVNDFENNIVDELIDLKKNHSGEHELESYWSDWLNIPHGEHDICHTLVEIDIKFIDENAVMWEVEI